MDFKSSHKYASSADTDLLGNRKLLRQLACKYIYLEIAYKSVPAKESSALLNCMKTEHYFNFEVLDGTTDKSQLLTYRSGRSLAPVNYTSTSGVLHLRFRSDGTYNFRGFNASFISGKIIVNDFA